MTAQQDYLALHYKIQLETDCNNLYATRYKLTKQVIVKLNTVKLRGSDE
jgi:hypothetical protein